MALDEKDAVVLRSIAASSSLAAAVALVPETWHLAVVGGGGSAGAAILPGGLPDDHPLRRALEERGLAIGRGATRLEALRCAASEALLICAGIDAEPPPPGFR